MSATTQPDAVVLCALDPAHLTTSEVQIAALSAQHHTLVAGSGASAALAEHLGARLAEGDPVAGAHALAAQFAQRRSARPQRA